LFEELDPLPRLVFALDGRLLWASARARALRPALFTRDLDGSVLQHEVRALGQAWRLDQVHLRPSWRVQLDGRPPALAELRVVDSGHREPFVVVDLSTEGRALLPAAAALAAKHGLTPAELDVFSLLGAGLSNEEIARQLFVSVATVKTHTHRILSKLHVKSRLQAALLLKGSKTN
jgi:DNA-binding CsgD family transcriptional regulator